jgi:hypothetical protein
MGPDSLIELIGHARVHPDGTYTRPGDGCTSDVGVFDRVCSRRASARYRYDNVALWRAVSRDFYAGSHRV